jgi:hypothetical protein
MPFENKKTVDSVWVFLGEGARFACAVFTSLALAQKWIKDNRVSGVLSEYPLDNSVLNWAIERGFVVAEKFPDPKHIQRFSSGHQRHYHFENGEGGE